MWLELVKNTSSNNSGINVVKLDDHPDVLDLKRLDCIKIDIEGFDLLALKGMSGLIEKFKPTIYAEFSREHMQRLKLTDDDLEDWIKSVNYRAYPLRDDASLGQEISSVSMRKGDVVLMPGVSC